MWLFILPNKAFDRTRYPAQMRPHSSSTSRRSAIASYSMTLAV
ncbi:MAG TPA: hypothetical protein V6D09_16565 [Leptolyngbyaceae cyanobacterium]